MAQVGSLYTSLTLESSAFVSGLKKVASETEKQTRLMERTFSSAKTAAAGFIGAISVGAVVQVGRQALDYAASLGEVAQQLGVSTDALQQYNFMATQVGLTQEEMQKALGRLTKTLGEAKAGSDTAERAFAAIGVRGRELASLNTETAMKKIADALKTIPDPAKRAAIEVAFFGRTGQKLDTLLAGGSGAVDELAQSAQRLGSVLSSDQIQKADETADKLAALKTVLEARIAGVVSDNADAILKLADAMGTFIDQAARIRPDQWAKIGLASIGGFAVAGPVGAVAAGSMGIWGANLANEEARAVMPGAEVAGASYDPKTGRWKLPTNRQPTATPAADIESLFRTDRTARAKKQQDPIGESISRALPDLGTLKQYRSDLDNLNRALATGRVDAVEYAEGVRNLRESLSGALGLEDAAATIETVGADLTDIAATVDQINNDANMRALAKWGEESAEQLQRMRQFADQAAASISSGFEDAILAGEKLGKIVEGLIEDIARLAIRQAVLQPISDGIAGLLGSFGKRAYGGPVSGGSPYIVGERGPEMFMPGRSGTIIPTRALRGMGGGQSRVVVEVQGGEGLLVNARLAGATGGQAAAVEVVRGAFRAAGRPRLPGALG